MIKALGVQAANVCVTPDVLRMASLAICTGDVWRLSVESLPASEIGVDILVAVKAEGGLTLLVERCVAGSADFFLLFVGAG